MSLPTLRLQLDPETQLVKAEASWPKASPPEEIAVLCALLCTGKLDHIVLAALAKKGEAGQEAKSMLEAHLASHGRMRVSPLVPPTECFNRERN